MKLFKSAISLILSVALLLSLAACGGTEEQSSATSSSNKKPTGVELGSDNFEVTVWNGSIAKSVAKGGGTEEFPYVIYTAEELAYAFTDGSKDGYYYQLGADIYLNDVSDKNWMKGSGLNQWFENKDFTGHLDGNGFCIYGLLVNDGTPAKNAGLCARTVGATFKNLGIRNSVISAQNYAGAFAGIVSTGKFVTAFENCFVDETVWVMYVNTGNNGAGGLIGYAASGGTTEATLTFKNCYSKAQVSGLVPERVNGIIGTSWDAAYTMESCYSVSQKPFHAKSTRQGSMLLANGHKTADVYKNIYTNAAAPIGLESWKQLSSAKMKGEGAKSNMSALDFDTVYQTVEGGYPKLAIFESIDGKDISAPTIENTVLEEIKPFASGSGTQKDPYIIKTDAHLRNAVSASWKGSYFKMANDIYVNPVTQPNWGSHAQKWVQSNTVFEGNFDGCGHTVYGLYLNDTPAEGDIVSGGLGLFPGVGAPAVVRNVHVKESYLTGKAYVGAIAGQIRGSKSSTEYAQIIGCSADESVVLMGQTVGGILGGGGGGASITYCSFTGVIAKATGGEGRKNGIVGDIWSKNYKMAECFSVGYNTYRGSYLPTYLGPVYGTTKQNGITQVTTEAIYGEGAKSAMPGLSWGTAWKVSTGYPKVQIITPEMDYKF